MTCDKCKNYEPKEQPKRYKNKLILLKGIIENCKCEDENFICKDCVFDLSGGICGITAIRILLRKVEAEK